VKKEYHLAKAAPVFFNCAHCTQLLQVPEYWICKSCTSQNPREKDDIYDSVNGNSSGSSGSSSEVKDSKSGQNGNSTAEPGAPAQARKSSSSTAGTTTGVQQQQQPEKQKPNSVCKVCNTKRDEKDYEQVMCGKCNQPTHIPHSNFSNQFKKNSIAASRAITKALYDLSGTPYIICDNCGTNLKIPEQPKPQVPAEGKERKAQDSSSAENQALLPAEVTCVCKKVFRPTVEPQQQHSPSAPAQNGPSDKK
jgi:hypothetical protein